MLMRNRAEEALSRYRTNDPELRTAYCLWFCKDILNWEPNGPQQIFWMDEALHNLYVLLYSVPRGGKTMSIEAVDLYETVMNTSEDLRIYAPKLSQCKETLKYHYDWIDASPLLKGYLRKRNGKPIFSTETYEFLNHSNAMCYTIKGEMEGHNVSISRIEEFDDWTWETFVNVITRRMGAKSKNEMGKRMRITGTIQGEENIYRLLREETLKRRFKDLSEHPEWGKIDIHLLLSFGGVMELEAVEMQRDTMTPDEWARSMLLMFTESRNFIWSKYIRAGQKLSNLWGLEAVPFVSGDRYKKAPGEIIGIGFDCGHGGQKDDSSCYSLQIFSETRTLNKRYIRWLNGFNWAPDADTQQMEKEIVDILDFYRPDGGYGDALKMDIIRSINKACWLRGITGINPDDWPENTPANWDKWFIKPMWNNDKNKHEMYSFLQHAIHKVYLFFPYYDRKDDTREAVMCRQLLSQLTGIRAEKTSGNYPRYKAENKKIGDDDADAAGMGMRWLAVNSGDWIDFSRVKITGSRKISGGMLKGW